jgi:hypothetical protein
LGRLGLTRGFVYPFIHIHQGELAKHAVSEGQQAVVRFSGSK